MSTQIQVTAGRAGRKLKRNQIAELEAKMGSLSEIERQKNQKIMHDERMALEHKALAQRTNMAKERLSMEEMIAQRQMGVSALKFGAGLAMDGGKTFGQIGAGIKGGLQKLGLGTGSTSAPTGGSSIYKNVSTAPTSGRGIASPSIGRGGWKPGGPGDAGPISGNLTSGNTAGGGFFSGIKPGALLGSGLAGFGASRMVKGKGKRMLIGGLAGGLMSLFGGGGFNLGQSLGGALFGGLGGLV